MSSSDLGCFALAFLLPSLVVAFGQAVLNRIFHRASPQVTTMVAMVLGYLIYFAVVQFIPFSVPRDVGFYLYLFLIYSFAAYTYFHLFNMSETSRRVRMIQAIARKQLKSVEDLNGLYDDQDMVQARLNRLVSLGQIAKKDGLYYRKGKLFPRTALVFYGLGVLLNRPWPSMKAFRHKTNGGR